MNASPRKKLIKKKKIKNIHVNQPAFTSTTQIMSSHHRDSQQQKQSRFNSRTNNRSTSGLYRAPTHSQLHASQQQHHPGAGPEFDDDTTDQLSPPQNRDSEGRDLQINYAEELEKTEQSITLCLQEIDRNFAQAQRIIASSIVPVVERYGRESRKASDGARFWKSFLETSANVSLSGYEEIAINEGVAAEIAQQQEQQQVDEGVPVHYNDEYSQLEQSGAADHEDDYETRSEDNEINHGQNFNEDDVFTTAASGGSARRGKDESSELPDPPSTRLFASRPHKHPHHSGRPPTAGVFKQPAPPHARLDFGETTPKGNGAPTATAGLDRDDTVSSVASSPFNSNILPQDESLSFAGVFSATPARSHNKNNNDNNDNNNDDDDNNTDSIASPSITRHTVLDKNWRIQMTPHKKRPAASSSHPSSQHHATSTTTAATATAAATKTQTPHRIRGFREQVEFKKQSFAARFDSSPLDGLEPPKLHTDLSSPTPRKKQNTGTPAKTGAINFGPAIYATPRQRRRAPGAESGPEAEHTQFTNNGPKTPIQRFYEEAAAAGDSSFGSEDSPVHTPSNPSRVMPAAPGGDGGTPTTREGGTSASATGTTGAAGARAYNNTFQDDDTSLMGLPEGMSPPVTMQFTMPSDVLQRTPAREVAQSIVQDILRSAGADAYDLDLDQPE